MAGGKDHYTVRESEKHPGKWAVYKNGVETKHNYYKRENAAGKALTLNVRDHGG